MCFWFLSDHRFFNTEKERTFLRDEELPFPKKMVSFLRLKNYNFISIHQNPQTFSEKGEQYSFFPWKQMWICCNFLKIKRTNESIFSQNLFEIYFQLNLTYLFTSGSQTELCVPQGVRDLWEISMCTWDSSLMQYLIIFSIKRLSGGTQVLILMFGSTWAQKGWEPLLSTNLNIPREQSEIEQHLLDCYSICLIYSDRSAWLPIESINDLLGKKNLYWI